MLRKHIAVIALLQVMAVTGLVLADRVSQTWSQSVQWEGRLFLWGFIRHAGYVLYLVPVLWGTITLYTSQERANIPAIIVGIILLVVLTMAVIFQVIIGVRLYAW